MPFELGLFIAARRYGNKQQRQKVCLILDGEPYRYQAFLSDIAGQDIRIHDGDDRRSITVVRNWLATSSKRKIIPGGTAIYHRYLRFRDEMPAVCERLQWNEQDMTFTDYAELVSLWLGESAHGA